MNNQIDANTKLDELMAVGVMGWSIVDEQICEMLPESRPPGLLVTSPIYNWYPTKNPKQAKICAVKYSEDTGNNVYLEYSKGTWMIIIGHSRETVKDEDFAFGICKAIEKEIQ